MQNLQFPPTEQPALEAHLEFLVAVCVGLHGLTDERRELQLLLLQLRPELRGQDDGGQGERRLLLLAQPRFLLANVAVDPARVRHVLDDDAGEEHKYIINE